MYALCRDDVGPRWAEAPRTLAGPRPARNDVEPKKSDHPLTCRLQRLSFSWRSQRFTHWKPRGEKMLGRLQALKNAHASFSWASRGCHKHAQRPVAVGEDAGAGMLWGQGPPGWGKKDDGPERTLVDALLPSA